MSIGMIIFNVINVNVAMSSMNSHVDIREKITNIDKNICHHRHVGSDFFSIFASRMLREKETDRQGRNTTYH
jgi:hypothetical protein